MFFFHHDREYIFWPLLIIIIIEARVRFASVSTPASERRSPIYHGISQLAWKLISIAASPGSF